MVEDTSDPNASLRILHVLRAPLGGLFRHVLDLTREQVARGHAVGMVADTLVRDSRAEAILSDLEPSLTLGISRVPIYRNPHPSDIRALLHVIGRIRQTSPDIVHGHGSKGGALARLPGFVPGLKRCVRAYTPHGGSLNYRPGSRPHGLYMAAERLLRRRTDLLLFESGFIASRYGQFVGRPPRLNRVIHNGIAPTEFSPVLPSESAADFLYVGELRSAKGIDILLQALARASRLLDAAPTLLLVGSGPDREVLEAQVGALDLSRQVSFCGTMPVRQAFTLGRTLVVPSRAESLPYVVLEAAGAAIPIIATNVGGIPEIFGPMRRRLIASDSVADLADAIVASCAMPATQKEAEARELARYAQGRFSAPRMVESVLAAYREALLPNSLRPLGHPETSMALSR